MRQAIAHNWWHSQHIIDDSQRIIDDTHSTGWVDWNTSPRLVLTEPPSAEISDGDVCLWYTLFHVYLENCESWGRGGKWAFCKKKKKAGLQMSSDCKTVWAKKRSSFEGAKKGTDLVNNSLEIRAGREWGRFVASVVPCCPASSLSSYHEAKCSEARTSRSRTLRTRRKHRTQKSLICNITPVP